MANIVRVSGAGGGTAVNSCPFPVGFGGFFQNDPNSIYAGTKWEQKNDVFILAAGDTYPAGATGGEAEHVHKYGIQIGAYYGAATVDNDANSGALQGGTGEPAGMVNPVDSNATINSGFTNNNHVTSVAHFRSIADTSSASNMPPYYTMPFWIRTA